MYMGICSHGIVDFLLQSSTTYVVVLRHHLPGAWNCFPAGVILGGLGTRTYSLRS